MIHATHQYIHVLSDELNVELGVGVFSHSPDEFPNLQIYCCTSYISDLENLLPKISK